jgi:hypothetical protein
MRLTRRAGSCDNGPCPNIFDTDTAGLAAVQGTRRTDPSGTSVLVPRTLLTEYVRAVASDAPPQVPNLDGQALAVSAVVDTDHDDLVAVRGPELADPEALAQLDQMPAHETVVLVSQAALLEYALAAAPQE